MARNSVMDSTHHGQTTPVSIFLSLWFRKMILPCSQRRSLDAADENREVMSRWIVAQSEGWKGKRMQ
jgi:hypothetical protein